MVECNGIPLPDGKGGMEFHKPKVPYPVGCPNCGQLHSQEIYPTEYGREDGLVAAVRVGRPKVDAATGDVTNTWALRSVHGPAWFWSRDGRWEISTRDGFSLADDPRLHFTTGEAFPLLRHIAPASKMRPPA
jgi:hypothetical protein